MPLLWTYLIRSFCKSFILCISSFLVLLLITKIKEIAKFIAISSDLTSSILFFLLQTTNILPIAIPISALITTIALIRTLSESNELTAFRYCGISVYQLFMPFFFVGFILFLSNFYIISEIYPLAKQKARSLLTEKSLHNPIDLLQRQKLTKLKNAYLSFTISDNELENLYLIVQGSSSPIFIQCNKLCYENQTLKGDDASYFYHFTEPSEGFYFESCKSFFTEIPFLSSLIKNNRHRLKSSSLPIHLLRIKTANSPALFWLEIIRRFSLAFSTFSFIFIGFAFGMRNYRQKSSTYFSLVLLCITFFISFLIARQYKVLTIAPIGLFILPHIALICFSLFTIKRVTKGNL